MKFTTITTALSAIVAASAAPAAPEERGCSVALPTSEYYWMSRYYNPEYNHDQPMHFDIPAGAVGACDLHVRFPALYHLGVWGNTQVEIKKGGSVGGTYTFAISDSAVDRTVGSFSCEKSMDFLLSISKEQGKDGFVGFEQTDTTGFYITYNC